MAGIISILFFVTTFLAAGVAVLITAFVQSRMRSRQEAAQGQNLFEAEGAASPLLQQETHSSIGVFDELLAKMNAAERLRKQLDEAGLRWSVGRVAAVMLLAGSILAALAMNTPWLPTGSFFVAFAAGGMLPLLYTGRAKRKRMEVYEAQFPDALESIARAMRAGHPLQGAFEILAADFPAPLGVEFRRIRDERNLGMPWKGTLENFAARVPIAEVRLFVAAAMLNSRTGGRFTEVLENLAENIRDGSALKGEVRAIAAHGKMTGSVLTVLPFGIALMLHTTSPDYLSTLTNHPLGPSLIGAGIGFIIAGHFIIQRIVRIQV
ncbi:MAG: hypothetical protein FJW30_19020 [Acidobacteria bacterium]|nr:hypothetical protein [Acidobacteriota bacterium]